MCALVFPSEVWANKCALYRAKYGASKCPKRLCVLPGRPQGRQATEWGQLSATRMCGEGEANLGAALHCVQRLPRGRGPQVQDPTEQLRQRPADGGGRGQGSRLAERTPHRVTQAGPTGAFPTRVGPARGVRPGTCAPWDGPGRPRHRGPRRPGGARAGGTRGHLVPWNRRREN